MVQEIGRYKILEKIGQGAMAEVFKAHDPKIDRTLAIKVLREERCTDAEYRVRFLREAKAAGILAHPNIVTVYDVGEVEDRPYIAMELLEGTPLDRVMKTGQKLPLPDVVSIGIQLAQALGFAHSKGIVHRDMKPSNIVRSGTSVKVTDFGIARIESQESARQTQMGEILGTPQYMSPEQVLGKDVDARSDLFSVGVILYQLLSGETPFEADTLTTLLYKIATEEPKPINIPPDLPASLKRIVERLLKKQPEKRYQSAKEVADALALVQQELQAKAEEGDLPRVIPIRITWTLAMAVIVAVTMAVTGVFIYRKQHQVMQDQVMDYGSSLVRFLAVESAVPVLSEDWISIELFIKDTMERQGFSHLTVVDHAGAVRGSNDPAMVGKKYEPALQAEPVAKAGDVTVQSFQGTNGDKILDFETPILFQKKEVGQVHLGLFQAPLERVSQVTVTLLLVLLVVTVAAVAVIAFVFGTVLSRPVKILTHALGQLAAGNYEFRIPQTRNDEFGRLFRVFDRTAETLRKRHAEEKPEPPV